MIKIFLLVILLSGCYSMGPAEVVHECSKIIDARDQIEQHILKSMPVKEHEFWL